MMVKLVGILPYIYFFDEPVQLGPVSFIGVPDWQGRNYAPSARADRESLQELSACFPTSRGLSTDKGAIKVITYFLLVSAKNNEKETLNVAQKAITLLRYALLRPDNQALDNIESTYLYVFALPPSGSGDYRVYQCWPNLNQEIWISPKHERFPPPGWDVDSQLVHTSQLEDMQQIRECFYTQRIPDQTEAEVLLAMEWYLQSFQKYTIRNISGRLVDIATAFETLFQLPRFNKKKEFQKRIKQYLGLKNEPLVDEWASNFYGDVRSQTVHTGKPVYLSFRHPDAQLGHLGFLWSAQRIFRECVAAKTGLPRHIPNDRLMDELTPNEVHLSRLRKAGSFEKIQKGGLLREVEKLRPIYPAGNREDIIWLGKELLRSYKEQFLVSEEQSLPTLDLILGANANDRDLGLKYYQFSQEFRSVYFRYVSISRGEVSEEELRTLKPITRDNLEQIQLESAIYHFATYAGWALLMPT